MGLNKLFLRLMYAFVVNFIDEKSFYFTIDCFSVYHTGIIPVQSYLKTFVHEKDTDNIPEIPPIKDDVIRRGARIM